MADRGNAEVLQILDCQAADHVEVDMVLAESRLVFSEPELPQPARDIHARLPGLGICAEHAATILSTLDQTRGADTQPPPKLRGRR